MHIQSMLTVLSPGTLKSMRADLCSYTRDLVHDLGIEPQAHDIAVVLQTTISDIVAIDDALQEVSPKE